MDEHDVECEVCGKTVKTREDGTAGVIIEHQRFNLPERTEYHGFCETHRPDDVEATMQRIKQGLEPVPGE